MSAALARTCVGTTKAGEPCRSRIVGSDGFCWYHSPTRPIDIVEQGRRGGLASGVKRREQAKSVRDRLREKVEADFETIWSAFEIGLESDDERNRLAAAVAVLAEAYGRPPQAIIGDPDAPVRFELVSAFSREES